MRIKSLLGIVAAASLATSCSHKILQPPVPRPSSSELIQAFVRSERIPKPHEPHIFASLPSFDVAFFSVDYGNLHYDLAGNWYSLAFGVKNGPKIGWIVVLDPPDSLDIRQLTIYAPAADDSYLFSETTWHALDSDSDYPDEWLYWGGFLPMLARSSAVPERTLLAVAEQLKSFIAPDVGWLLLGNPTVDSSREILTVLANLPVFQGDSYSPIRAKAQQLLDSLPP